MFRNPLIDALVVLLAALLIFGPKRLPMLGRGLGQGMREFKDSITGESRFSEQDEPPALPAPAGDAARAGSSETRS
ncbi:MAG TPA: twin-arginine translocase TatA/TatE family subunit [Solirubrobacteraceae bacterium]|nr:twin-arginine translocase TatA/TatE family subunit [Solirubrobacteraceae bacterium]